MEEEEEGIGAKEEGGVRRRDEGGERRLEEEGGGRREALRGGKGIAKEERGAKREKGGAMRAERGAMREEEGGPCRVRRASPAHHQRRERALSHPPPRSCPPTSLRGGATCRL